MSNGAVEKWSERCVKHHQPPEERHGTVSMATLPGVTTQQSQQDTLGDSMDLCGQRLRKCHVDVTDWIYRLIKSFNWSNRGNAFFSLKNFRKRESVSQRFISIASFFFIYIIHGDWQGVKNQISVRDFYDLMTAYDFFSLVRPFMFSWPRAVTLELSRHGRDNFILIMTLMSENRAFRPGGLYLLTLVFLLLR